MSDLPWKNVVSPLKIVLSDYWKISRGALVLVTFVAALSSVTAIAAPYVFSRLIDRLMVENWFETVLLSFALYAILLGLSVALQNMVIYLSLMSSESLSFVASTSFFRRILKKTIGFFIEHNAAEIQNAEVRGRQSLNIIVQLGLIVFIPGVTQITLALIVLGAAVSMELVVVVFVYGASFIALTYFANKMTRPYLDDAITASQDNAKFVGNAIGAMETLRHFGSERWMDDQFAAKAAQVRDSWRSFSRRRIGFAGIYGVALAVQLSVSFFILLPRYRAGLLSVGDVVLFNALLLQLNQPFEMIGRAIDDIIRSYSEFKPFVRMWNAEEETKPEKHRSFDLGQGCIAFEDVGYTYEGGRGIDAVSFVAGRGCITFLTGKTGSGKSSIFKLVLKSLEPQEGQILVDGVDLREISRADWFSLIGVVPQDIVLLNDTLRTNIILGRPVDEQRLRDVVEKAAILEFIDNLPEGFETIVGERGLKLSGGERQRIAIARALYGDPKILLLDEASSALDVATEQDIMTHIRLLSSDVTVLAITHRKSVISGEDRVISLKAGKVSSKGKT